jgi:hypothetical protein
LCRADIRSHGSATPMRGKSPTCRQQTYLLSAVLDREIVFNESSGKTKTCRASEWQSQ